MLKVLRKWSERLFANEEAVTLLLLLAGLLVLVVLLGDVLAPMIASLILAFILQGVANKLQSWGASQRVAVSVAFLLFIGVFLALLLGLAPLVWQQLLNLVDELPRMLGELQKALMALPEKSDLFTESQIREWINLAGSELGRLGQYVLSFSIASLPNIVGLLIYLVLVPILVFFFLKDKRLILGWLGAFLPNERPLMNRIWGEMNEQVANYVRGKAVEILIVGAVSYIIFAWLGLNYAALLGLLVGLSVLIPYIGAAVVTIPVAMVAWFQWGSSSDFIYLMVAYGVIQALDGNVLVPLLFSEAVNLHPVAIILAVLVFGGIWGFWGVFFAIPLATLVKALLAAWPAHPQSSEQGETIV